jgi:Mrp family chromosome partitioning ATPase
LADTGSSCPSQASPADAPAASAADNAPADAPAAECSHLDKLKTHPQAQIKHAIAVVSGKGGVGKSLVAAQLAVALRRLGFAVGVLDADITGPTMARAFGISDKLQACQDGIIPQESSGGIKLVSTNMVLPDESTPVLWRGTIISNLVRQFWSEVLWGQLDYLIIDLPPGTGDVALTIFQSLPLDGAVVVSTPQDLVAMIVAKAINMAQMMEVPVLAVVENMSYYRCECCDSVQRIFGPSTVENLAHNYTIEHFAEVPITPTYTHLMDTGKAEEIDISSLSELAGRLASA